jgi:DNA-binding SARP family transcriptional activator
MVDGDRLLLVGAPKMETLLAAFLARTDQVLSVDQLIAEIWGVAAPRHATAGLRVMVSNLRKLLNRPDHPIVTRSPGYLFRLGSDQLDAHEFLTLADAGERQARQGALEQAVSSFDRALATWRGPMLGAAVNGPVIGAYLTWLSERRIGCIETGIDAELQLGRDRELVPRLYALVAEYPLHEPFYRQLMIALYRAERSADALEVYRSARNRLRGELGLEPCRSLRNIQRAILQDNWRPDLLRPGVPLGEAS